MTTTYYQPYHNKSLSCLYIQIMSTSADNNALDILMNNARSNSSRKRPLTFFACPAGCGASVTTMNVNLHLDRCLGNLSDDKKSASIDSPTVREDTSRCALVAETRQPADTITNNDADDDEPTAKRKRPFSKAEAKTDAPNAFSHMMKQSATVFSNTSNNANIIRHRFHLHNAEGLVTWTSEDDYASEKKVDTAGDETNTKEFDNTVPKIAAGDIHWSATTTIKKVKTAIVAEQKLCTDNSPKNKKETSIIDEKELELTISCSVPFSQGDKTLRLVARHSRLSVSSTFPIL